jgi:hypothetical protein
MSAGRSSGESGVADFVEAELAAPTQKFQRN